MAAPKRRPSAAALAAEEAALRARIAAVKRVRSGLAVPSSTVSQTVAAYQDILDDVLLDIALEVQRGVKTGQDDLSDLTIPAEPAGEFSPATGPANPRRSQPDVFGNAVPSTATAIIACTNCGKRMAGSRFAPHLEKCMGVGERAGGRPSRTIRAPAREL